MRQSLAEKLLLKIMEWDVDQVQVERPMLQAMSNFKYDEYRQFFPGMHFLESLTSWLRQFETIEERKTAYSFVKSQLVFVSENQMQHLVSLAFSDAVQPFLLNKTGEKHNPQIHPHRINKIYQTKDFLDNKRKTLFVGLSDGSRIGDFRRVNSLMNDQVVSTYQISPEKSKDLKNKLQEDGHDKFDSVFLIDDFTASGKSYFRQEGNGYSGKIFKFIQQLMPKNKNNSDNSILRELISNDAKINVLFYIATESAKLHLETAIKKWEKPETTNVTITETIYVIQIIPDSIRDGIQQDKKLIALMKKYFDESIVDFHYKKGKYDKPYLGFNGCSLPLVLNHNTPNNSIPILWFSGDKKYKGLFPRITRHFNE